MKKIQAQFRLSKTDFIIATSGLLIVSMLLITFFIMAYNNGIKTF